jgi:hypothetical protein
MRVFMFLEIESGKRERPMWATISVVMPALDAGIHDFLRVTKEKDVDGRVKPGHDEF